MGAAIIMITITGEMGTTIWVPVTISTEILATTTTTDVSDLKNRLLNWPVCTYQHKFVNLFITAMPDNNRYGYDPRYYRPYDETYRYYNSFSY